MTELDADTDTGTAETLRELISRELTGARERTSLLTDGMDEADLVRQHSPLMSPLVWDLAHIANQEELWLLREVGGRESLHPEIDPLYDAFCRCCRPIRRGPTATRSAAGSWTCLTGPGSATPGSRPDGGSGTGSRSGWSPSTRCSTTRPC